MMLVVFRLYATAGIAAHHYVGFVTLAKGLLFGAGNDVLTGAFVALVFSPLVLLLFRLTGERQLTSLALPFFITGAVCFALERYFIGEMVPLGADFWSYSSEEISETVSSSLQLDGLLKAGALLLVFAWVAVLAVARKIYFHFDKRRVRKWLAVAAATAAVLSGFSLTFDNLQDQHLSSSRLAYFIYHSVGNNDKVATLSLQDIDDYPFESPSDYADVLGPWFGSFTAAPHFIFIQAEGLGGQFVGNGTMAGFTPFLDSLSKKSLFWPNCVSTTGRTFGVVPALYGSLPYGNQGFMDLGPDYPSHFTLISWLKRNGYRTTYFYGGNINFDKTDIFLEAQGIDELVHEGKFPEGYQKITANAEGFSWGYPDKALFDYYLKKTGGSSAPRLDMLMTVTLHEPFKVPEQERYSTRFDHIAARLKEKEPFATYRNIFETLLYTDDALRALFKGISGRRDWHNTIVVVTGDHRVIPLPQQSPLDRFHVPLLIYSPALQRPQTFKSLASHAQVTPSLVALLKSRQGYPTTDRLPFISGPLPTASEFESELSLPLMRNKGELDMYLHHDLLLAGNRLFRVDEHMKTSAIGNAIEKQRLQNMLATFRLKQEVALGQDRLWSAASATSVTQLALPDSALAWLEQIQLPQMVADSQLVVARRLAAGEDYERARWVAAYLLNNSPNYTDARLLLGRSYAWEGDYQNAIPVLLEAQRRQPGYEDVYQALADAYYWADQPDSSEYWVNEGLKRFAGSAELRQKKERLKN